MAILVAVLGQFIERRSACKRSLCQLECNFYNKKHICNIFLVQICRILVRRVSVKRLRMLEKAYCLFMRQNILNSYCLN
jgi:hypothetical protein